MSNNVNQRPKEPLMRRSGFEFKRKHTTRQPNAFANSSQTKHEIPPQPKSQLLDAQQRAQTGRRSGWFDYRFVFEYPHSSKDATHFITNSVEEGLSFNLSSFRSYFSSSLDSWTKVPSPTLAPSSSSFSDVVVHLTAPPPQYGRMPNREGYNAAFRSSDVIFEFPDLSTTFDPSALLSRVQYSLRNTPSFFGSPIPTQEDAPTSKPHFLVLLFPTEKPFAVPSPSPSPSLPPNPLASRIPPSKQETKKAFRDFSEFTPGVLFFELDFNSKKEVREVIQKVIEVCVSGREGIPSKPPIPNPFFYPSQQLQQLPQLQQLQLQLQLQQLQLQLQPQPQPQQPQQQQQVPLVVSGKMEQGSQPLLGDLHFPTSPPSRVFAA